MKYVFIFLALILSINIAQSQPEPCGAVPIMANNCADACVICDIDGYTGTNNLEAGGMAPPGFCSTPDDMHWIAFIAGSTSLKIRIDVFNCTLAGNEQSLDLGFYESLDCQTFSRITTCRRDLEGGDFFVFETTQPLVIGQHYYLVMDGSSGAICDWSFTVEEGSTAVAPIDYSGEIEHVVETCPGLATSFEVVNFDVGAALFLWSIDGQFVSNTAATTTNLTFPQDGNYEICVRATNACDSALESCTTINVRTPETLSINEILCEGECVEANGIQFCDTGTFQEIITLPNGCDSTINLELVVLPQPLTNIDVWICDDDFYYIGDTPYNTTGSYSGTVLTANDCDSIVNLELLVIVCEIIGVADSLSVICNGTATGTLIFSVNQGTPPLTYTYTNLADPTITGTGMTNLLVDNEIPNIPAGQYQIYIQDDFGNDAVVRTEVLEPDVLEIQLEPSDYNGFNVSCNIFVDPSDLSINPGNDGTLTANVKGGESPYMYLWDDGQTTQTAVNLTSQQYTVTVTDNLGCTIEENFTLISPTETQADVDFVDPNCDGFETGFIQINNIQGGIGPYTFGLNNANNLSTDSLYPNLLEGVYNVFFEDANGCLNFVQSNLTAPDIPVLDFGETPEIDLCDSVQLNPILNNTFLETIEWSGESSLGCFDCLEPYASPVNDAEYFLTVTSVDGCSDSDSIKVLVNKQRRIYVPDAFSPNKDGINDVLIFHSGCEVAKVKSFSVFDRWGNLVYEANNFQPNDVQFGWDGDLNAKKLDPGVYVWYADVDFIDGESIPYHGSITLFR